MALTLGGALAVVLGWSRSVRWLAPTLVGLAVVGALALAYPMREVQLGNGSFPAPTSRRCVRRWHGCTTTDWPMTLIQMDLLQSDIDRGCRFVVDLGGYSYYLVDSPYHQEARRENVDWQALALDYYRSGDAVIPVRFAIDAGFSRATARTLEPWPVIVEADGYAVRRPEPARRLRSQQDQPMSRRRAAEQVGRGGCGRSALYCATHPSAHEDDHEWRDECDLLPARVVLQIVPGDAGHSDQLDQGEAG